jgi:lipopolysaccharide export system protein LptA
MNPERLRPIPAGRFWAAALVAAGLLTSSPLLAQRSGNGEAAAAERDRPTASYPINIEADEAEYSQRTGVSVYRGRVFLEQGGLELRGKQLTISRNTDSGAIEAVLTGAPATLRKPPDENSESLVTGHADRMEYRSSQAVIVLTGKALVERGGDVISGETIRHHINTATTQAESAPDGDRVRITIQPESDAGSQPPAADLPAAEPR